MTQLNDLAEKLSISMNDVRHIHARIDTKYLFDDYYLYAHVSDDGRVFYIGKGKGVRCFVSNGRSKKWCNFKNKNGINVFILTNSKSESEILKFEIFAISKCKELNIGLTNLSDGGEGSPYNVPRPETRMKQSLAKLGKKQSPEHAEKSRNAKLGKKQPRSSLIKLSEIKSKPVINSDGEVFKSATFASIEMGSRFGLKASQGNISSCASGKRSTAYGLAWSYDIDKPPKLIAKNNLKPLIRNDGVIFKSSRDASRYMSIELSRSVPYQSIGESARSNVVITVFGFSFKFYF